MGRCSSRTGSKSRCVWNAAQRRETKGGYRTTALEAQQQGLERLQAEKELKAARAMLEACDQEAAQEAATHTDANHSIKEQTSYPSLNREAKVPKFKDFAAFVAMEAEVACNPVTYFDTLHSLDSTSDKRNLQEHKKPNASVLSSQAATDSESQRSSK
ncbi:hypothetical protein SRHO_G00118130 [Serrasalmus rhombeus]